MTTKHIILILTVALTSACASTQPVIYPNAHSAAAGELQRDRDIAACQQLARDAGASPQSTQVQNAGENTVRGAGLGAATGAVGGAIGGNAGRGAAVGAATGATAGLLHSIFGGAARPNPAYRKFVERCLTDRGYDIAGWN
tara:strand:- start:10463 stop:10885 length:423 start_codon:yes stop_codon:yes gene_type:complete